MDTEQEEPELLSPAEYAAESVKQALEPNPEVEAALEALKEISERKPELTINELFEETGLRAAKLVIEIMNDKQASSSARLQAARTVLGLD